MNTIIKRVIGAFSRFTIPILTLALALGVTGAARAATKTSPVFLLNYRNSSSAEVSGWTNKYQEGGGDLAEVSDGKGHSFKTSANKGGNFKASFSAASSDSFQTGTYTDVFGTSHTSLLEEIKTSLSLSSDITADIYNAGVSQGARTQIPGQVIGLTAGKKYVIFVGFGKTSVTQGSTPCRPAFKLTSSGCGTKESLDYVVTQGSDATEDPTTADTKYTAFNIDQLVGPKAGSLMIVRFVGTPNSDGKFIFDLGGESTDYWRSGLNFLAVSEFYEQQLEPIAMWDRDFVGATTQAGAVRGDFTLRTTDGGTVAADGSYVTVGGTSAKTGALVDWATSVATSEEGFKNRKITMIVRYENLQSAGNIQTISTFWTGTTGSETTAAYQDRLGFLADKSSVSPSHKSYGIAAGTLRNAGQTRLGIPCETSSVQNSMAVTFDVSAGYTAYFRTGQESAFTAKYSDTGLYYSNENLYGAAIGGTRMTPSTGSWQAAKQMRICAVAVFNTVLTPEQIASYEFPNDPKKWGNLGTPTVGSATTQNGAFGNSPWTVNFAADDNVVNTGIGDRGKVRVRSLTLMKRASGGTTPTSASLTQDGVTIASTSTEAVSNLKIYSTTQAELATRDGLRFVFPETAKFDVSKDVSLALVGGNGSSVVQPANSKMVASSWSPALEFMCDCYAPNVVSVNFGAANETRTVSFGTDPGAVFADAGWYNTSSTSGTISDLFGGSARLTYSAGSNYQKDNQGKTFNKGYFDDGSKITLTFSNLENGKYDVVIYCASDNASGWSYKTVNGVNYSWDATTGKAKANSTDNWGSNPTDASTAEPGAHALLIRNLEVTDGTISISSKRNGSTLYRGCVSAVQLVKVYTATVTQSTNWSDLEWSPSAPTPGANVTIVNNGTDATTTLTFDTAAKVGNLSITGAAGKVLRLSNISNLTAASYDFSEALGGVGIGVTGGWTVPDALKNHLRDNEAKVIFDSKGDNGATLAYTSGESVAFKSHLVFNGGTHTFKYGSGSGGNFAVNATAENPTLLVKDGTTLNFHGRDLGGWQGTANLNAIVQVEAGGKLYAKKLDGTFYYHQRFTVNPGAELWVDATDADNFRLEGGVNENATQIYVPDGSGTACIKPVNEASDTIRLHHDETRGVGIAVGTGSTLDIQTKITNEDDSNDYEIGKYGAGLLKLSGDISGYWKQTHDRVVKFSVYAGDMELAMAQAVKCQIWFASNLKLTGEGTEISGYLDGAGKVVRNGTGTVTITASNNSYTGGTEVQAGTLKVAEGASIGTGNYSVAAGAVLDLPGTFRSATAKLVGTSQGVVGITLTAEELAMFEGGEKFTLQIPVEGETLATTIKAYDSQGTERQIESATIVDGKISIQKKADAKVPPFNLTTTENGVNYWEEFAWKDSTPGSPREVVAADWVTKVGANVVIPQGVSNELYIYETPITLAALHITNAYALVISDYLGGTITADAIDDSASTGRTTLDFALGTASVAAGANIVLTKVGESAVTVGEGKTVTLPGWTTPANVTGAGDVKIAGAEKTTAVNWGPNGITGKNILVSGTWAITAGSQYIGAKPFWIKGANAVFKVSGATDILYSQGTDPIYVEDGGEFHMYDRDTSRRALALSNGGKMIFDGDDGGSGRSYDFYTDSSLTVKGATPCVIGGLTAGSTTASGIVAIRRGDFTITVDEDAELQCYSAWAKEDGGSGSFTKAGLGKMVQYRSSTSDLPFVVSAGSLKLVDGGNVTTAGITVNADATIEINTTNDRTYANAFSGAGAITKTGAGTLTLTGSPASFTGVLTVSEGTVKVTDETWLTGGKLKFAAGTSLIIYDKTSYDGEIEIELADASVQPTITVKSSADDAHEFGATVSGTLPSLTVSYTPWVDGKGALYAWEFSGSLASTGRNTESMGKDHGPYYTDDNQHIYAYSQPYNGLSWPAEFTTAIACTLPTNANVCLVGWGQASPGGIALTSGDVSKHEVKMVYWQNNQKYTELATMMVPNADTCEHLYLFTKTADGVKVYLDGSLVVNYSGALSLGVGVQVGTVFQGVGNTGLVRLDTVYSGTSDCKSAVNTLRIYDAVLGPNAIAQLKKEFPYTSPNGTYTRALTGTANTWNETDAWTKTKAGEEPSQVDVPAKDATVSLSATDAVTISNNLTAPAAYEAIYLSGEGTITIAADDANANKVTSSGNVQIGANAVVKYSAVDLGNTPIEIMAGKKLTIDASMIDVTKYFTTTVIPLTGLVTATDESTQFKILPPTAAAGSGRTVSVEKSASTHFWEITIAVEPKPFVYTVTDVEPGVWTWGSQTVTAEQVAARTSGEIQKAGAGTATLTPQAGMTYTVNTDGGTLKFGSELIRGMNVTVNQGGTFDLNGLQGKELILTLAGGKITDSVAKATPFEGDYIKTITLTADSEINVPNKYQVYAQSYGTATTIALGSFTLTKTGTERLQVVNTDITGTGMIYIEEGEFFGSEETRVGEDVTFKVGANGVLHNRSGKTMSIRKIVGAGGTLNNEGTVPAFTLTGSLKLANAGTYGTITLATAESVLDVGGRRNLTVGGSGKVDAQLTAEECEAGKTTAIFTPAQDATVTIGTVTDKDGAVIPAYRYTTSGGSITMKKEARIGTTIYFTLYDALEAIETTEEKSIVLLANITENEAVTTASGVAFSLDLAGFDFLPTATITLGGTMTITDSSLSVGHVLVENLSGTCLLTKGKYTESVTETGLTGNAFVLLAKPETRGVHTFTKFVTYVGTEVAEKKVYPISDPTSPEKKADVVIDNSFIEANISDPGTKSAEEISKALTEPRTGGNKKSLLESYVLGLKPNDSSSVPLVTTVQNASTDKVTLSLGNVAVKTTAGVPVKFALIESTTPEFTTSTTGAAQDSPSFEADVPTGDAPVKYYRIGYKIGK